MAEPTAGNLGQSIRLRIARFFDRFFVRTSRSLIASQFEGRGSRGHILPRPTNAEVGESIIASYPLEPVENSTSVDTEFEPSRKTAIADASTEPYYLIDDDGAFPKLSVRYIESEMRPDRASKQGLAVAGRWDAQRMNDTLDDVAAQIVVEQVQMTQNGPDVTLLNERLARRKAKAIRETMPQRSSACGRRG
ncbi:MAG: hypothetical protein Q9219_003886 [cf. Caloplaca sp. 3 TL-2023]